jgi:hypothetical protein
MRAIRTERFKYVRNFDSAFLVEVPGDVEEGAIFRRYAELYHAFEDPLAEMYDLESDPWEQHNLAGDSGMAEIERSLERQLRAWMFDSRDPLLDGAVTSPAHVASLSRLLSSA